MKPLVRVLVLSLALPALASAQTSVAGSWAGSYVGADSEQAVLMALTVRETELTGSIIVPGGVEFSIKDGLQAGSQLQFVTLQQEGDAEVVVRWVGTVDGDTITFSVAREDGQAAPQDIVVTRQS